jgi:thioredoxin reductase (NADPH)
LIDPEHVFALITSSIDQNQVKLQVDTEKYAKDSGVKIAFVDGYRNKRIVEKLGLKSLPALVELRKGELIRNIEPKEVAAVKFFVE